MLCELYLSKRKRAHSPVLWLQDTVLFHVLHARCPNHCPTLQSPLRHSNSPHPVPRLHPRAVPMAPPGGARAARSACYKEGKSQSGFPSKQTGKISGKNSTCLSNYRQKRFQGNVPAIGGILGPRCQPHWGTLGCLHSIVTPGWTAGSMHRTDLRGGDAVQSRLCCDLG